MPAQERVATDRPVDHLAVLVDRAVAGAEDPTAARLRRAMAGESPARFLGRLVLERAAHLVRETDHTLQDVAADCGFRGYDVFARAFRRELGALPSEWRASPTSYLIDAPGEVHFQPPDGLRLPARSRTDGADLVVEMAEQHARRVGDLVAAAGRVPGADPDAPVADADLGSALTGLVARMEQVAALVHETTYDVPAGASPRVLAQRLEVVGPDFVAAVALLATTGRFDEAFLDAFSPDPVALTFGAMVTRILTDADDLLRLARDGVGQRRE